MYVWLIVPFDGFTGLEGVDAFSVVQGNFANTDLFQLTVIFYQDNYY